MATPASRQPSTFPRVKFPMRTLPSRKPAASVRKIASSGWPRRIWASPESAVIRECYASRGSSR